MREGERERELQAYKVQARIELKELERCRMDPAVRVSWWQREKWARKSNTTLYGIYPCVLTLFCQFQSPPNPTQPIYFYYVSNNYTTRKLNYFTLAHAEKRKMYQFRTKQKIERKRGRGRKPIGDILMGEEWSQIWGKVQKSQKNQRSVLLLV